MGKSALTQVSERYEQAKREHFDAENSGEEYQAVVRARRMGALLAWAQAMAILQSERGNFVG